MKQAVTPSFRNTLAVFAVAFSLISIAWGGWFWSRTYYNSTGLDDDGKKVYAGKVPIDSTRPYNQFKMSSRSELAKLHYLLDRLGELEGFQFRFMGEYYDKEMTHFGFDWLIAHRYNGKQPARDFIREQNGWLEAAGDRLLIQFPDGKLYHAADIIMNELDLLDETYEQEKTVHFLLPAGAPPPNAEKKKF